MNELDQFFEDARKAGKTAFLPFLTAGDPDISTSVRLAEAFFAAGRELGVPTAVEVGFPYSDPIADGPIIQESYNRALANKVKLGDIFSGFAPLAAQRHGPVVAMISQSLVHRLGPKQFVATAQQSGFAGAIVPDLPVEESLDLHAVAKSADFKIIHLIAPTTPLARRKKIAAACTGFLYYVAVTGITGERKDLATGLPDAVRELRRDTALPICVGFGIGAPDHVAQLRGVADGVIVGSAIVKRLRDVKPGMDADFTYAVGFVRELMRPLI